MTTLLEAPDWAILGEELMSNFDHEVDQGVAQQLRDGQVKATYSGWNFNATCWFADDRFHAAVYVYHVHYTTVSETTPEKLMASVSDAFGWD